MSQSKSQHEENIRTTEFKQQNGEEKPKKIDLLKT